MALMVVGPTPTGCTYTVSAGVRIAYGTSRERAPLAQRALDDLTAKVRSFVESGIRLETVNGVGMKTMRWESRYPRLQRKIPRDVSSLLTYG